MTAPPHPQFHIRPYRPEDLPRLQEITRHTFGPVSIDKNMEHHLGEFSPGGWAGRKIAAIAEDCRLQPDGVFVAEDPTTAQILGYVTTRLNELTKVGWIPNLAVDPSAQNKGMGRALIEHAITFFRHRGMQVAKIETLDQNPIGQKLYPSLGFKEVARQIHYAMRLDEVNEPQRRGGAEKN